MRRKLNHSFWWIKLAHLSTSLLRETQYVILLTGIMSFLQNHLYGKDIMTGLDTLRLKAKLKSHWMICFHLFYYRQRIALFISSWRRGSTGRNWNILCLKIAALFSMIPINKETPGGLQLPPPKGEWLTWRNFPSHDVPFIVGRRKTLKVSCLHSWGISSTDSQAKLQSIEQQQAVNWVSVLNENYLNEFGALARRLPRSNLDCGQQWL